MEQTKVTIAVLEDDKDIRLEVCEALEFEQYDVICAGDAAELKSLTEDRQVDLYLVDLGLPDANGFDLVRRMRFETDAGIIILSGRSAETDKVVGLELGADDYIAKPFSPRELIARISSVLRRRTVSTTQTTAPAVAVDGVTEHKFSNWTLSTGTYQLISPGGVDTALTKAEFELLLCFLENRNRVLSRDALVELVKGQAWAGYDRAIDGLVSRLRKKFDSESDGTSIIKTVHGVGYIFPED